MKNNTKNKKQISLKDKLKAKLLKAWEDVKFEFKSERPLILVRNIFLMIVGAFVLAFAYQIFYFPLNIISGGVSGLSILFNEVFPSVDTGLISTIITWLFFFIGLIFLGLKFSAKTLVSTICYSLFVPLVGLIGQLDAFNVNHIILTNPGNEMTITLICAIFGGLLTGMGCAITFIGGGSTGGVDCLVLTIHKYLKIKAGLLTFLIDAVIISFGFIFVNNSDLIMVLIGIMATILCSLMIDKYFLGGRQYVAFIMSSHYKEISSDINYKLDRGTTLLSSVGGFTARKTYTLNVSFDKKEYNDLLAIIYNRDPNAFVSILRADQISGHGFSKAKIKKSYMHLKKANKNIVPLEEVTPLNDEEKFLQDMKYKNKKWY